MAQQTAIDWLIQIISGPLITIPQDVIDKAKQMEKEQIMDAYDKVSMSTPEQYYNETYNK